MTNTQPPPGDHPTPDGPPPDHIAKLEAVLHAAGEVQTGDTLDLTGTALALAGLDAPDRPLASYHAHVSEMIAAVGKGGADPLDVDAQAAALAQTLSVELGYTGDWESYDDMRNADLIQVIDRRKGLPVALGLLYITAARGQGWHCEGINFPAHFLIRLGDGPERRILDPFNGGKVLDPRGLRELLKYFGGDGVELKPHYYEAVSDHDLILRLLNNIKGRAINAQDFLRADETLGRMLMIAPGHAALWHERGLVQARIGKMRDAVKSMQNCQDTAEDPRLKKSAEVALEKLRQHLN